MRAFVAPSALSQRRHQSAAGAEPAHGRTPRGSYAPPPGRTVQPGKFGRMFPRLTTPLDLNDDTLFALARTMIENAETSGLTGDNEHVPAGYTYLGQFIDHDITFDTTSISERVVDRPAVENFRTPKLELDSVYGIGPAGSPYLYARDGFDQFIIGECIPGSNRGDARMTKPLPNDLPRNTHGTALIGDPRNDENLLVAQLHLAFLKFHNKLVTETIPARSPQMTKDRRFAVARREVVWHYQWIVLNDFLRRIIDNDVLQHVLTHGRRFYRFEEQSAYSLPYIPLEFSVAAYRLGHSMVRQGYNHNRAFNRIGFNLLFLFSGKSGAIRGTKAPPAQGPSFASLPADWPIDWHRFFELGKPTQFGTDITEELNAFGFNFARKLDPYLAPELHRLPPAPPEPAPVERDFSLPFLNLRRGVLMGLPSGQDVARHMNDARSGISFTMLTPEQIEGSGPDGKAAAESGLHQRTPLWYYVLKEAQILGKGQRLGPVGSRILAEVFVGLLQGDDESFLTTAPDWKPTLGKGRDFTMPDLLRFVGDLDPLNAPGNRDKASASPTT
ncbi:heme peroxidase [Siccirubricoccus deserti]|uniref:Heme peroxidase n=2 Tax=Siccirubricoccus deserti TaxID=2013562 RepID=A0A9X0R3X4_9PROT|nr:heme peroxidase [Siccirubricoccus deserti]